MMDLNKGRVDTIIRFALKEDGGTGDVTSQAVLDKGLIIDTVLLARQNGIVCGMEVVEGVFEAVDTSLKFRPMVKDGARISPDQEIAFIEGDARSIMKAERTAINFLSLLSGVATRTREMVDKVAGTTVKIYDTRKTIPLHRYLQKYAVTVGGGHNHRYGLWDMVLMKDNHIRAFAIQRKTCDSCAVIKEMIARARAGVQKNIRVEIEVETLKECECALQEKPDVIMLDNMSPKSVAEAVELRKKMGLECKVLFEVSGGITLDNIRGYAETGIDIISSGSLTSSVSPVDYSLEVVLKDGKISARH